MMYFDHRNFPYKVKPYKSHEIKLIGTLEVICYDKYYTQRTFTDPIISFERNWFLDNNIDIRVDGYFVV